MRLCLCAIVVACFLAIINAQQVSQPLEVHNTLRTSDDLTCGCSASGSSTLLQYDYSTTTHNSIYYTICSNSYTKGEVAQLYVVPEAPWKITEVSWFSHLLMSNNSSFVFYFKTGLAGLLPLPLMWILTFTSIIY